MTIERTVTNQTWANGEMLESVTRSKSLDEMEASYPTPEESAILAARLIVLPLLTAGSLTDEQVEQFTGLFPTWTADGVDVKVGEVWRHDGTLVEVVQAHKPQADREPSKATAALWKLYRADGSITEWVQPIGSSDAYKLGEQVSHKGTNYTSKINANTTEPGTDGSFHRWWEPAR